MSLRKKISWCLLPLTMWYAVGVAVRNLLFDLGILKQHPSPITTIGVGNIACGGTGKTPHVEYLLRLLQNEYRTALLSRGYRRKSKGFQADDSTMSMNERVQLLGDEPAMVAQKFPQVQVTVCEKRVEGMQHLVEMEEPPQVVVLDDVYQHRHIKPSLNILLTEYGKPYFKDRILPYGDLRESRKAHRRADIIVVTKSPAKINPIERRNITNQLKAHRHQKVYFSYLRYGDIVPINGGTPISLDQVRNALVVTGIANPTPMLRHLKQSCKVQHLSFGDHHAFSKDDIEKIRAAYESLPQEQRIIVTTEKDAVRLMSESCQEALQGIPIYSLPIEVVFHENKEESFDEAVTSRVKESTRWIAVSTSAQRSVAQ